MALSETRVVATEIEKIRKALPVLYEREDTFFSMIEKKNVEEVSKRDMRIPMELRPGGFFGHYDPDGGSLGRGDGPTYDKAVINVVHLRYGCEYTRLAEWSTDTSRKAVVQTVRKLTASAMVELRRALDCLYHTGGNGVLATISDVSGGGPYDLTCDDDNFGVKLLRFGQKVDVYDSTLNTKRTATSRTITALDIEAKTLTISGGAIAGIGATDLLVVEGLTAPPVSLYGIPYHANDSSSGTWLGYNRSSTPEVRANSVDAQNAALALTQPRLASNKVGNRLGKDAMKKLKAFMHPCQKAQYEDLAQQISIIQKQAKQEGLDLYFGDSMQMAGHSVETDYKWDKTRIDFQDTSNWGRPNLKEIDFYDVGGKKLFEDRDTDGSVKTSVMFYLVVSTNAFVDNPAEFTYIKNLAVLDGY